MPLARATRTASSTTAAAIRVELARSLVEADAIGADALRTIIVGYSGTGDRTMGHAHGLLGALERHPVAGLFDAPLGSDHPIAPHAERAAADHIAASLPHIADDYMGTHWLATYALLALG
eukprot:gene30297-biopygen19389